MEYWKRRAIRWSMYALESYQFFWEPCSAGDEISKHVCLPRTPIRGRRKSDECFVVG
jgi:hypothetical protein